VLGIGRLVHQKGFDFLVEAFHRSGLAQIGWKLVILGEGDQRPTLIQLAKVAGIYHALEMPGHVDNVGAWLEKAEIFVLPSRYEGFPNALIEAMQLGCAVVSFDCPSGPSDLIQHGQNGLLVPAEDIDALAVALRRLGNDRSLRLQIGSKAVGVNERFSPDEIYGRWLALVDEVATG
jgi:glycosyltransferase involved in cell wall biosynthesis